MGGTSAIIMKYTAPTDKKMQIVGTAPKSNRKVEETEFRIKTPDTYTRYLTFLAWSRHLDKRWCG